MRMIPFLFLIFIPVTTLFLPGRGSWLASNFSVAASTPPARCLLIFWGGMTGGAYRWLIRRTCRSLPPACHAGHVPVLADISAALLFLSVLLPYRPERYPLLSFIHTFCAFHASVLFYLLLVLLDLKRYFQEPARFSSLTAWLFFSVLFSAALFILAGFLISSVLEVFCTIFSSLWLYFFSKKALSFLPPEQRVEKVSSQRRAEITAQTLSE